MAGFPLTIHKSRHPQTKKTFFPLQVPTRMGRDVPKVQTNQGTWLRMSMGRASMTLPGRPINRGMYRSLRMRPWVPGPQTSRNVGFLVAPLCGGQMDTSTQHEAFRRASYEPQASSHMEDLLSQPQFRKIPEGFSA